MGFEVNDYQRPNPNFITSFCQRDHQTVKTAVESYDHGTVSHDWGCSKVQILLCIFKGCRSRNTSTFSLWKNVKAE